MHTGTRFRAVAAALIGAVVAIGLLAIPAPAFADTVVPACVGTTSTPAGVANTPTSFTLTGGAEADYLAGKTVVLYDNQGRVVTKPDGTYQNNTGGVPFCGVHLTGTGADSHWIFCTDESLYGCPNHAPSTVPGNAKLSQSQEKQIAYVLYAGDQSSKRSRAVLQTTVWCISESRPPGSVFTNAQSYFDTNQFDNSSPANPESAFLTTAEVTCLDQAALDSFVTAIPANPTITLTAPAATLLPGTDAVFTLAVDFVGEVDLTVTGNDTLGLCSGSTAATLSGTTLAFPAAGSVELCLTRGSSGDITVAATSRVLSLTSVSYLHYDDPSCQVFVDFRVGLVAAGRGSEAQATFVATSPSPSPSPSPSNTLSPEVPAAGGDGQLAATGANAGASLTFIGFALGLGMIGLLAARMRAPRRN